jgi:hypothetical protein
MIAGRSAMKPASLCRIVLALTLMCAPVFEQIPPRPAGQQDERPDEDMRLPNGKSQRDEILKADHEKILRDAADLVKISEDLRAELEKTNFHILPVSALKQLDQIDKLTKHIRTRLKRY